MFPADIDHIEGARELIAEKVKGLGKWTMAQKNTLFAFLVAVVLWVTPGIISMTAGTDSELLKTYNRILPESAVAMVGALLLFFLPVNKNFTKTTVTWR